MRRQIETFLARWLPSFAADNRSYLTVAIGCTGGQHRSVYCVESLAARFRKTRPALIRHRALAWMTKQAYAGPPARPG